MCVNWHLPFPAELKCSKKHGMKCFSDWRVKNKFLQPVSKVKWRIRAQSLGSTPPCGSPGATLRPQEAQTLQGQTIPTWLRSKPPLWEVLHLHTICRSVAALIKLIRLMIKPPNQSTQIQLDWILNLYALYKYMLPGSSDGSDVSPSNWTGLVDLEEEASLHSTDAGKGYFLYDVLMGISIDHERMWICENKPLYCILSLRPLVLRAFRLICGLPTNPWTEFLRLGRTSGAWSWLRGVSQTASQPHSCWEEGWSGVKLVF